MKKLRGSLWAKALAVTLLCLLALSCMGATIAITYLADAGAYDSGYDAVSRNLVNGLGYQYCQQAGETYLLGDHTAALSPYNNFRYTVESMDGEELYSNYKGEASLWDAVYVVTPDYDLWTEERTVTGLTEAADQVAPTLEPMPTMTPVPQASDEPFTVPTPVPEVMPTPAPVPQVIQTPTPTMVTVYTLHNRFTGEQLEFTDRADLDAWERDNSVRVHGYVLKAMTANDEFSQRLALFSQVYAYRALLPWIAGVSLLLGIALFVFLMSAAGHHDGTDTVTPSFVERVPWDVFTVALGFGFCALLFAIGTSFFFDVLSLALCAAAFLLAGLLFLLWCMSSAVRLKMGTLIRECLIFRILRWCWRVLKKLCHWLVTALPIFWKWALGIGALAFIDLIWRGVSEGNGGMMFFGWLLFWLLAAAATFYAAMAFRRVRLGAQKIAAGDESATVDTKYLIGDFKAHAEDLNNIRAGLSRAVDERMKSERFKTELITNVSHDIKTPLTSIVSYVDLLSREEIENETAKEYIEVLQRQSGRMKKLIEDLLDASKASTGNLPVTLTDCELGVLLEQAAGEYSEKLSEKQLELVVKKPEEAVTVRADNRHLWRILDNLMNNILKYAQAGTRVYLTLERRGDRAELSFRNISASPLNFTGEELSERFVRGDASRSTEGSGLGLAIAKSLADLQDIGMDITVDGDLFKVVLMFKNP